MFQGKNLGKLEQFIEAHPDATLEETKQYFLGVVECSIVTIHNTLKRLELRYKKNRCVPANKTERIYSDICGMWKNLNTPNGSIY